MSAKVVKGQRRAINLATYLTRRLMYRGSKRERDSFHVTLVTLKSNLAVIIEPWLASLNIKCSSLLSYPYTLT